MRTLSIFVSASVLLILLAIPLPVNGQFQAMVKRATAETTDGIRFTVWLERQAVTLEQSTTIYYEVENRSNETIYLVRKSGELETAITDDGSLLIMVPIPFSDDHRSDYSYTFTKVERSKSHRGRLTFSGSKYNKARRWSIIVAFGLVTDITGLDRQLRPNEDPAPLRGLLGQRIETIGLSGLTVEVKRSKQ